MRLTKQGVRDLGNNTRAVSLKQCAHVYGLSEVIGYRTIGWQYMDDCEPVYGQRCMRCGHARRV